ncbi:MAG TPA: HipA family kinase [Methylomirabilota bacterium]|nr:HipA family kinase [Methylomirabilota bacterium]
MEILYLAANQFIRPMGAGRTCPVLLGAGDGEGKTVEVVTKLRGPELSVKAQIAELVAAPLAAHLGLEVPEAAVVDVPAGFEAIVPQNHAAAFRASPGSNFGSVHLGTSFTTWAVGRAPAGVQRDQAAEIFAFDLLVQNADRRATNPNLWSRSERLGVYDHEQAFSFLHLPIMGGPSRPWVLADQAGAFRFMESHAFYPSLRGAKLNLGPFEGRLAALSDEVIEGLLKAVPAEWQQGNDLCAKTADYLREAREERTAFFNFVKHLLR